MLNFVSAVLTGGIALAVLLRGRKTLANAVFVVGLGLLMGEALCAGLTLSAVGAEEMVGWEKWRLSVLALIPSVWLLFSLVYARGNYREFLRRWKFFLTASLLAPLILVIGFRDVLTAPPESFLGVTPGFVRLGWAGVSLYLCLLILCILILVNLERTFSTSVGTMRWRIKFMVLGLAMVFGVRIYSGSQTLLYHAVNLNLAAVNAVATMVGCVLIGVALVRTRLGEVEIYPSHAILRGSLTIVLAGIYLVLVGLLSKLAVAVGGDASFPLKAFVVLVGLVGMGLLLLSDRVRQRLSLLVSRHFRRPMYDYRTVWSAFTECTTSLLGKMEFCRAVARLISETFGSLSVSVWLVDEGRRRLSYATSTLLAEDKANELVHQPSNCPELLDLLRANSHPVDIDNGREPWIAELHKWNPDFFKKGGNRVCVPLVSGGEVQGLITLADRVSGVRFSIADLDLLKCIGDQVAASLRNLQLSQQLVEAKEKETFQTMATFFVHDLKNVAYTLSLMLQNMTEHFGDPAFREDALRSLSRSVKHLNDVVGRFNLLRQGMEMKRVEADLNEVITAALAGLGGIPGVELAQDLTPLPRLQIDPDQVQKVITNLVLNAKDAVGRNGQIKVQTFRRNGWAAFAVTDNGVGMSTEFVEQSLFRPFRTTKKNGLGIGMFHSKMIVEAHHGKMEVESEPQKGTTFRVLLPLGDVR